MIKMYLSTKTKTFVYTYKRERENEKKRTTDMEKSKYEKIQQLKTHQKNGRNKKKAKRKGKIQLTN